MSTINKHDERSLYDIQKGDIVEVISASLTRKMKYFQGIGFVVDIDQKGYKIYWRERKAAAYWQFPIGYLKRLNRD